MKVALRTFVLLTLLAWPLLLSACSFEASFMLSPTEGTAPLNVTFTNTSGEADEYLWDFGDGNTYVTHSPDETVQHEYTKTGSYTINLTAKKNETVQTTTSLTPVVVNPGVLSSIVLEPETVTLSIGESCDFTAKGIDAYGNTVEGNVVDWDTENGTINAGSFTAGERAGTYDQGISATFQSSSGSMNGYAAVTIQPGTMATLEIVTAHVTAGQSVQMEFVAMDEYGNLIDGLAAQWSLASVYQGLMSENGQLTAGKKAGEITGVVTVEVTDGDKTLQANGTIIVIPDTLSQIGIAPEAVSLGLGMSQTMVAVGADQYGNRITENISYTWSSSPEAGTISPEGAFIAGNTPGTFNGAIQVSASTSIGASVTASTNVVIVPDRIMFISDRNNSDSIPELFIMNADGSEVTQITHDSETLLSGIGFTPDGRRIIFVNYPDMLLTDLSGTWSYALSSGLNYAEPSISPTGDRIAFQSWEYEPSEICVMDIDGGNLQRLTENNWYDDYPTWSPDGNKIAFNTDRDGDIEIYMMNPDGSQQERLTNSFTSELVPRWSPVSNSEVALYSDRHGLGTWGLFILSTDTKACATVHAVAAYDCVTPDWSPDGSQLVFCCNKDDVNGLDVYIINRDGTGMLQLTDQGISVYPHFVPRMRGVTVTENSVIIPDTSNSLVELKTQELTAQVQNSVVRIKTDLSSGSGFIIDSAGIIITNNHVVSDATTITVYLADGTSETGTVTARDMVHDIALIKISRSNLQALKITDIGSVGLGQQVVVMGFPLGQDSLSITSGLVSSIQYDPGRNVTLVQTDSAINPGNSGGPVLDLAGNVIGMVSSKLVGVSVEGIGYAISANTLTTFLPRMLAGETISSFE